MRNETIKIGGKPYEIIAPLGGHPKQLSKGSRVKCISQDEHASRWGSNSDAAKLLTIGQVYTLAEDPEVHSWHTKLYLEEIPGEKFNSVQFEGVER